MILTVCSHERGPPAWDLFAQSMSRRHQSHSAVHGSVCLQIPKQGLVYSKAHFDEQNSTDRRDPGSVIDSSEHKKAADCRHCDNRPVISLSIITFSPVSELLYTQRSRCCRLKGGLPFKIFIASSFKSIRLYKGSQASTVRNWAAPVVITSLLISTDGFLAMGSAWLAQQHIEGGVSLLSLFSPYVRPIWPFHLLALIMEHT